MPVFIKDFEIDAVISESHELSSEITDHPIEKGSDITDHVRPKPRRYTMTGKVSDTPIGTLKKRRDANASSLPSADCQELLEQLWADSEIFTVQSVLKVYENVVIESCSFPVDRDTGAALDFTCSFRQLEIVETERAIVIVGVPHAANKSNKGNKTTKANAKASEVKFKKGTIAGVSQNLLAEDSAVGATATNAFDALGRLLN